MTRKLNGAGFPAAAIHGNKTQNARQKALDSFRRKRVTVLVATDVAARGIDIAGVTHVINYDMPVEPESYVHRIGRTGRAGEKGIAVSFCTAQERDELRAIQKLIGKQLRLENSEAECLPSDSRRTQKQRTRKTSRRDLSKGLNAKHARKDQRQSRRAKKSRSSPGTKCHQAIAG